MSPHGSGDDVVEITEHPVLDLLGNGTPHLDATSMREVIETYLQTLGTAFLKVNRDGHGISNQAITLYNQRRCLKLHSN